MGHFAVACLQLALAHSDNIDLVERELRSMRKRFPWVHMAVLPELGTFGASADHAQTLPGDAEHLFCSLARELDLWLIPGSLFERRGERLYNTAPVISPAGDVIARYSKVYPWAPYERDAHPGEEIVTFDVPGVGRFGVSICYDMWFPETIRAMVWNGAEVILHPSLTNTIDRDVERAIARSSAAINQCYFLDVNGGGDLGFGRSGLYGPGGEILHEAEGGREIIAVELDLDYVRRVRSRGWQGLGQTLKSFRDGHIFYPQYDPAARSPYLDALGSLEMPGRDRAEPNTASSNEGAGQ